jgi:hypothetical protein
MTVDEAAKALAALVRKVVWSPHSGLRHTTRAVLRKSVEEYERACKRKTGFERLLSDDGEHLPGSEDATTYRPKCKFCDRQFKPRHKKQKWCSTECRKAAFYDRQRRIKRGKAAEPVVEESLPCSPKTILDDD